VLQLIGLAFLVGAAAYPLPWQWRLALALALLFGYWALIRFVPVPGVGVGVFEEDQNVILHLNRVYLEAIRLRGLPSAVPTGALVLIATLLGDLARTRRPAWAKGLAALGAGAALAALGALWSLDLGYNKTVWTSSYILLGAGTASAALGAFLLLLDATGWRRLGAPLEVFGSNALLAYVGPILVKVWILQGWQVGPVSMQAASLAGLRGLWGVYWGGWAYTAAYILAVWLALWWLRRRGVLLKV
jgi:predicted acyltransferase